MEDLEFSPFSLAHFRRQAPRHFDADPLLERQAARESNARSYPRRIPLALKRAQGLYVEDVEGRQFIDCLAGAGTLALGHNHPVVIEAIQQVLADGLPLHTLDLTTPVKDRFVQDLFDILPPDFARRIKGYKAGSGTFRMNVALSELPKFTCLPEPGEHHQSGIILAPTLDYMDKAFTDARAKGWSDAPIVEMKLPTSVDDSLAPPGQSAHYVLSPVPHLGTADIDWTVEGPKYRDRILKYLNDHTLSITTIVAFL